MTVTGKISGFILYDSFMLCRGSVREVCDFILKVLGEESFFMLITFLKVLEGLFLKVLEQI